MKVEYRIPNCPYHEKARIMPAPCDGEMEYSGDIQTLGGTFMGVDINNHREVFKCKKCSRTFTRSWEWKLRCE